MCSPAKHHHGHWPQAGCCRICCGVTFFIITCIGCYNDERTFVSTSSETMLLETIIGFLVLEEESRYFVFAN